MRLIILVMILSLCLVSFATADKQDVIVLKSGSILYGQVTEDKAAQIVTVITVEGLEFSFDYSDVKSINDKPIFTNTKPRYLNILRLSVGASSESNSIGVHTIHGTQILKTLSLGVGIGFERYSETNAIPAYLDARFYFKKQKNTGYIFLDLGYSLRGPGKGSGEDADGQLLMIGIGIRSQSENGSALFFDGGYKRVATENHNYPSWSGFSTSSSNINAVTFSIGLSFN